MSKKKKTSYFVRYKNQKWIPYRYILYSYWFDFLKIASEEKRKIDWKFYKDWGGKKILDVSFRTFWVHNWERLFQVESEYTPVFVAMLGLMHAMNADPGQAPGMMLYSSLAYTAASAFAGFPFYVPAAIWRYGAFALGLKKIFEAKNF